MFDSWDREDTFLALLTSVIVAVASVAIVALVQPHNVDYYYLSSANGGGHPAYCVNAHWTWHTDEVAYCTDDKDKALEFTTKANIAIRAAR